MNIDINNNIDELEVLQSVEFDGELDIPKKTLKEKLSILIMYWMPLFLKHRKCQAPYHLEQL